MSEAEGFKAAALPRIREMNADDLVAAAAVHAAAFPRQLDSAAWIECNFRAHPRILCFVAELDGAVVGYVEWIQKSGFRTEVVLELEQLAVRPECRGRGIGSALIRESLVRARDELKRRNARIKSVLVTTRTDNRARRLYQKVLGAEPRAVIDGLYSADEVILVAEEVERRLGWLAAAGEP